MLEKLIAFYSRNNKNQQFYEYITIFFIVNQLTIISNLAAILDTHPIPIFDIALNATLLAFAVLPILASRKLWEINRAARFLSSAAPGRAPKRARTDRIENALLKEFEAINEMSSQKDMITLINSKINILIQKYTAISFLYMVPFFVISFIWLLIILNYHDSVFELIQKEPSASGREGSSCPKSTARKQI
ncbi:hypothetical protein [Bosea sp. CRIB-10]|uniref:hypothetical protein n=1 Tax=Bosea sp. CRIB-10 TaxID=378404 RepID=UPI001113F6ED|nr:hypothetical protein [Bosea sp. CRIB-10]